MARRLHEVDRNGRWPLLTLVPVIGWIILFVWAVMRGTPGPNRHGADQFATLAATRASSAPAAAS
jgi:uncharacterized membrane protein YhaH (DUF805 family)